MTGFLSASAIGFWYALELQLPIKWHKGDVGRLLAGWIFRKQLKTPNVTGAFLKHQPSDRTCGFTGNAKAATGHQNLPFFVLSTDAQNHLSRFSPAELDVGRFLVSVVHGVSRSQGAARVGRTVLWICCQYPQRWGKDK